jgi:DNA replication protein DnaC
MMHDQLRALIAQLRLHGMADALDAELARAEREAIAAPELLYRLLGQEAASRRERSLAYRLVQARLPWRWSLDSFPFDRQPGVSQAQIRTLAGLDFLRRADNVLLIGKPGTGKPASGSGCCVRPASTATAAVSTMLKSCSTNFTPRWRIAPPPGCWAN